MRKSTGSRALAVVILLLACGGRSSDPSAPPGGAPSGTSTIALSFKVDPRLQSGNYRGELWVSPPTYTGVTGQDAVEARAHEIEASGAVTEAVPDWIPSDREMVTVSPAHGQQVTITVIRAGESKLTVAVPGASKELLVRATSKDGSVVQVSISQ